MTKHEEFLRDLDSLQTDLGSASRALRAAQYNADDIEATKSDRKYVQRLASDAQAIMAGLDKMI